jgi:hypothetical protein
MSNNFGCKLNLKVDEHDVLGCENYPFVFPKVFLEGCADPEPYVEGTESMVVIRGNEMVTYTRGSITEVLKRDAAGNPVWVESRNLKNYDDDYWYDECWEDLREVKVHAVTECNFRTLEKRTYKVVFDEWSKMDSEDLLRAERFLDGKILDDSFVVKDGVLKHCLRPNCDLVIPEMVVEIEEEAISNIWYLESISLPASLIDIPKSLIKDCKVRHVTVSEGNPRYYTENGCLIDRYTETLLLAYEGVTIPEDGSVKKIGCYAFRDCGRLTSIVIPNWVTEIEDGAFSGCFWLEEVSMPDRFADRMEDIFGKKFVKEGDKWVLSNEVDFPQFAF